MFTKTHKFNFTIALSIVVLLSAFVLAYYHDMGNMLIRWGNADLSYSYLVPFIFIYIIYARLGEIHSIKPESSASGLPLIIASGFILVAGHFGSLETLTYISIWLALIALSLLVLGRGFIKTFLFPYLILAFIIPIPDFINRILTFRLKLISSAVAVKIMQMTGLTVFREGNVIDLGAMQLQVVDACSGLRYVYPLLLMGFVLAYFFNRRWWERLIVVLATIPISVFANSMRIAITGYLTAKVSKEAAEGFFHGFSGWLIFMVSILMLFGVSVLTRYVARRFVNQQPQENIEKTIGSKSLINLSSLKLSYILAGAILFILFWLAGNVFSSAQSIPQNVSFEAFPSTIGEWKGERSYLSEEILDQLWADDYVMMTYKNSVSRDVIYLLIPYYKYQDTRHTAHAPASCLVGGGYAPVEKDTIEREFPAPFNKVTIGRMVLEKDDYKMLSNFWFHQRGRVIASEYANKWFLFWDSMSKHRTDGALVRIEMPIRTGAVEAQKAMDGFTRELVPILDGFLPGE
jgi:exosortase D (VPLPA-CTERM-specific)